MSRPDRDISVRDVPVRDVSVHVGSVHVVVPDGIDDLTAPSGGNIYDRRVCRGLTDLGVTVREHAVAGAWPRPDASARASLDRALRAAPDGAVVLLDGLVACGVPDVVVPHAGRLAVVVLVHLPLGDEVGAAELAPLERETLHAARAVVATSAWTAGRLVAQHGLPPERVHVAVPGVDGAPLAPGTDGATRLLCVGSITPTKGHDVLVEALAAVADRGWTCDLVGPLARDPAQVAVVRDAIEAHGLDERIRLRGPRTGPDLAADYAAADLLVVPSRVEAYGMVVTEALARGIPVLVTDTGGVREALGHAPDGRVPGLLVAPEDSTAMTAALHRWFGDPPLRDGLRDAARARRSTLDGWEVTTRCLAMTWEQPLERLTGTPG